MKNIMKNALCTVLCVHFLMMHAYASTDTTQEHSTWRHRPIAEINWQHPADVVTQTADAAYGVATTPLRRLKGN